jgi:hypothetical protein
MTSRRQFLGTSSAAVGFVLGGRRAQTVSAIGSHTTDQLPPTTKIAESMPSKVTEILIVTDFGAKGDGMTDDTVAVQAAVNASIASGGTEVLFPIGTYLISHVDLLSYITLIGQGWNSKLKQKLGTTARYPEGDGMVTCNLVDRRSDNNVANNKRGIVIRDLLLEGNSVESGFLEINAIVGMQAVSDVLIERCKFVAPQGDGIAFYSGTSAAAERHCENLTIRDCVFDGVNYLNRNGISFYDVDGAVVDGCYFARLTNTGMPGAVCVEGRNATYVINRNVDIRNNTFNNVGATGTKPGVAFYFYHTPTATKPRQNFKITGNRFENCGGVGVSGTLAPLAATSPHNIVVEGNTFYGCQADIIFQAVRRVRIADNVFEGSNCGLQLGTGALQIYDVVVKGNTFKQIAQTVTGGSAILCNLVDGLVIENNTFIDIGRLDNTAGTCISFPAGSYKARRVVTANNNVVSSTPRTKMFFEGSAVLDATTVHHKNVTIDLSGAGAAVFASKDARVGSTDDAGVYSYDAYALTNVPNDFPVGVWRCAVSVGMGPSGQSIGVIETTIYPRETFALGGSYQRYAASGFLPSDFYIRNSNVAGTGWGAWYKYTGVSTQ